MATRTDVRLNKLPTTLYILSATKTSHCRGPRLLKHQLVGRPGGNLLDVQEEEVEGANRRRRLDQSTATSGSGSAEDDELFDPGVERRRERYFTQAETARRWRRIDEHVSKMLKDSGIGI